MLQSCKLPCVRLNQKRNISDQLHEFGVTASYNELRRSRISAAVAAQNERRGLTQFESQTGLVLVIADNFDAEISWGRDVAFRTQGALSDLHAVEARYHVRNSTSVFSFISSLLYRWFGLSLWTEYFHAGQQYDNEVTIWNSFGTVH